MARRTKRPPTSGANHLEWLRLVEVSGPFLSLPVLKEALPQGLEADDRDVRAELKAAHSEWTEKANDRAYHTQWIRFVLGRALELGPEVLVDGPGVPANLRVRVAVHHEDLRPDFAVLGFAESGDRPARLVVQVFDAGTDLERPVEDARWKASPATRMVELLRGIPDGGPTLGLVTNGEQWGLVSAPRKGTTTFVTWHASLWFEEKITLQALRTLLGARRVFGPVDETLERLIERSTEHQHDVTIQLGLQVREAIELLVRRIDELDRGSGRTLLEGVTEKQVYEAAVTVMMRLVFVFYLEEQADLYFPVAKSNFYQQHYALSPLGSSLRAEADRLGPDVLERRTSAWCRLLATFRAIHGGVAHVDMRLPAYGGHLFDPDRYSFLEGRKTGQGWRTNAAAPLAIDDATVLFVLEALQVLRVRDGGANGAETRRLSFRELGVEQIGNVYESLLDHTAKRAADAVVSLKGAKGEEPEIELRELEQRYDPIDTSKLVSFVKERTGRTEPSIVKDLEYTIDDDPSRWLVACGNDSELYGRVRPVAGLVREDRRKQPIVHQKDSIYVTAGVDRRSTGTHYTPRSLTEPIVQSSLEPLVYRGPSEGTRQEEWKLSTPREILELKVCDLACGSGAFLVQACRYLAARLVEAWQELEESHPGKVLVSPTGDLSDGHADDGIIPHDATERLAIARRSVVDRCLYGVDVNPLAAEMAKLSLWLVTLQRNRPFTFLDHAIKCGDSLLGITTITQIERFSLRPDHIQETFSTANLPRYVEEAAAKRRQLEELPSNDTVQIEAKCQLNAEAESSVAKVKLLADALMALELKGLEGVAYEDARTAAADSAEAALRKPCSNDVAQAHRELFGRHTFHWPLEFPEVFRRGGFDAFIFNPPFRSGSRISTDTSREYFEFIKERFAHSEGNTDLCCYFIWRVASLLKGPQATFGFLATNSISQGDNRTSTLLPLKAAGWKLAVAYPDILWPGSANLYVSWLVFVGPNLARCQAWLSGRTVLDIDTSLGESAPAGEPYSLSSNDGIAFKGVEFLGDGFKIDDRVALTLLAKHGPSRVIRPWLNGADLTDRPYPSKRYAIDFADMSKGEAQRFPECFAIVERDVRPVRAVDNRAARRERWWQFGEKAMGMRAALDGLERALVRPFTSDTFFFRFMPTEFLFTNALIVVCRSDFVTFAILNSAIHETWARWQGSAMKMDFRYTPSKCFATFPLPRVDSATAATLALVGKQLDEARSELMSALDEGLTPLYNRFHCPSDTTDGMARLRELHVEMDNCVASAFGWGAIQLVHGFYATKQGVRYTISETCRRRIIDSLMSLNHERHAQEVRDGVIGRRSTARCSDRRTKRGAGGAPDGWFELDSNGGACEGVDHGE